MKRIDPERIKSIKARVHQTPRAKPQHGKTNEEL